MSAWCESCLCQRGFRIREVLQVTLSTAKNGSPTGHESPYKHGDNHPQCRIGRGLAGLLCGLDGACLCRNESRLHAAIHISHPLLRLLWLKSSGGNGPVRKLLSMMCMTSDCCSDAEISGLNRSLLVRGPLTELAEEGTRNKESRK